MPLKITDWWMTIAEKHQSANSTDQENGLNCYLSYNILQHMKDGGDKMLEKSL